MKKLFKDLIKETCKGKSLSRILINNRIRKTSKIGGRILDLGSEGKRHSYYRFFKIDKKAEIISIDISDERNSDIQADLEKPFSLRSNKFDCVLCFNLLEHIFNYRNVIRESFRVLKPGGRFIGAIPFLCSVHGDPDDYFRYTKSSLKRIFKEVDFRESKIEALGYGPFSAGYYMISFVFPKMIRMFLLFVAISLDKILTKLKKQHGKDKYVLIYYFECKK